MHSLDTALIVFTIYNNWNTSFVLAFMKCYVISHILVYLTKDKFTFKKQHEYCNFADKRCFNGIRNFGDVISNISFILAGYYQYIYNHNIALGAICICVGIGSTYFHWSPTLATLYWDRLPMVLGMAYIMNLYSDLDFQDLLLHGLLALEYHHITNDLSLYVAYQLNMILFLTWVKGFSMPVILYIIAKLFEDYDYGFYIATKHIISGHTVKHILAGMAMMVA
jgi:hypothetical protein